MATEEINPNPKLQEDNDFDDHESEETLSLCDLLISNDQDQYEDHSCKKLHQSSSISSSSSSSSFPSDDQDLFEFFSEEWNIKTSPTFNKSNPPPPENIIFLGKMIHSHPRNQKPISECTTQKPKTKNIILHGQEKRSLGKSRSSGSKGSDKNMNEILVPRESIFTSLVKKRWYLILLGLPPKIPTDQKELMTDIKNRQSRHAPSTVFPLHGGDEEAVVHRKNDNGLWKLIKLASCFGGALTTRKKVNSDRIYSVRNILITMEYSIENNSVVNILIPTEFRRSWWPPLGANFPTSANINYDGSVNIFDGSSVDYNLISMD